MKGPLVSRTATDILRYLEKLAERADMNEWQIRQAVQAVRFLYQEQLNTLWARKWEWNKAGGHAVVCSTKKGGSLLNPVPDRISAQRIIFVKSMTD